MVAAQCPRQAQGQWLGDLYGSPFHFLDLAWSTEFSLLSLLLFAW